MIQWKKIKKNNNKAQLQLFLCIILIFGYDMLVIIKKKFYSQWSGEFSMNNTPYIANNSKFKDELRWEIIASLFWDLII